MSPTSRFTAPMPRLTGPIKVGTTLSRAIMAFALAGCLIGAGGASYAGNSPNYRHDESRNRGGPNQCQSDNECDGLRTCDGKWCRGEARPTTQPQPTSNPACNGPIFKDCLSGCTAKFPADDRRTGCFKVCIDANMQRCGR